MEQGRTLNEDQLIKGRGFADKLGTRLGQDDGGDLLQQILLSEVEERAFEIGLRATDAAWASQ